MKYMNTVKSGISLIVLLFAVTMAQAQSFKIDTSNSKVVVEGTSNLRDWSASVGEFSGVLELDDAGNPAKVKLTLQVLSMDGGRGADMNAKIYKALKSEEHPVIIFESTSIDPGTMTATGTLAMAGQQKDISVQGQIDLNEGRLTSTKDLKLSDFEIEPPSALFGQIKCRDEIKIMFDISLKAQ